MLARFYSAPVLPPLRINRPPQHQVVVHHLPNPKRPHSHLLKPLPAIEPQRPHVLRMHPQQQPPLARRSRRLQALLEQHPPRTRPLVPRKHIDPLQLDVLASQVRQRQVRLRQHRVPDRRIARRHHRQPRPRLRLRKILAVRLRRVLPLAVHQDRPALQNPRKRLQKRRRAYRRKRGCVVNARRPQ